MCLDNEDKQTMSMILSRKSIRRYAKRSICDEQVMKILQAGMSAPSAFNRRPWCFVIMNDEELLKKIPAFHEYAGMLNEAPVAIVVCGDTSKTERKEEWIMDCSAAAENMLLAAHEIGLGSVWVGIFPFEKRISKLRDLIRIPNEIIPLCILPIGYPAESKKIEIRYDSTKIHYNHWE